MGSIYKLFQFLRSAESRRGRKERRNMITERSVIWMLLNSHDLYGIVAVGMNTREYQILEFTISANTLTLLCHTDVTLIDQQRLCIRTKLVDIPSVWLSRIPHLSGEYVRLLILHHTCGISRYTLTLTSLPAHHHLVELAVTNRIGRQHHLPHTALRQTSQLIAGLFLPAGEVADEGYRGGIGCIFAKHPRPVGLTM